MKTMMIKVVIMAAVLVVTACNSGLSNSSGMNSKGMNERTDRRQRTTLDGAKYVDFTAKGVNAAMVTKQDILFELNGTFRLAGGNSTITIDRKDGTVTLSSDDAFFDGRSGRNFYAHFKFDVRAADQNCLYLKMEQQKRGNLLVDEQAYKGPAIPDLSVCLPLYGYSRNRIEVSPVMQGYAAMPAGTYWAVKK